MLMRWLRLLLVVLASAWFLSPTERVQAECVGYAVQVSPFAFETLTVSTVAVVLTSATYTPTGKIAALAVVSVETNPIRFRSDGTAPTSTVGHLGNAGDFLEVCGTTAVKNFKMIRQGGADATVMVSYFEGK